MSSKDYDVVLVGAGVCGALLAWKLGSKGYKVLVLEAGKGPLGFKQRDEFVNHFQENPIKSPSSPYPLNTKTPQPDVGHADPDIKTNPNAYYVYQQPDGKASTNAPAMGPIPDAKDGIVKSSLKPDAEGSWFQSTYNRQSGGTTWHWLGTSLRFNPNDFRLWSTYKPKFKEKNGTEIRAYDWPISYNEIESWYSLAEKTVGISAPAKGQDYLGIWRSAPYPMPEIPQSYSDLKFSSAIEGMEYFDPWVKKSYKLHVSPTPQARNSVPGYGGRAQCLGSASCIPICPIQAKYDATQHLELALKTGNVSITHEATVHRVLVDDSAQVTGVVYRDYDGKDHTVNGRIIALTSHAIENAKILLNSPWKKDVTVANSSDQVGRNLADHPVSLIYALHDEPVYPYRGPQSTSGVEVLKDGEFRKHRGCFRMELGNDGWEWPTYGPYNTPTDVMTHYGQNAQQLIDAGKVPVYGKELATQVADLISRQSRIGCLTEQLPHPDYRVTLPKENFDPNKPDYDKYDQLGLPRPILSYGIDEYAKRSLNATADISVQLYKRLIKKPRIQYNYQDATGNTVIDTARSDPPDNDQPYGGYNIFVREGWAGAGHLMGTHRMGDDAKDSVTDKYQRSHDHSNLFLLGSGLWPSYTASNPTLTIMALSLWASQTIDEQLKEPN